MSETYLFNLRLPDGWRSEIATAAAAERRSKHNLLLGYVRDGLDASLSDSGRMVKVKPGRAFINGSEVVAVLDGVDQTSEKCTHPINRRIGSGCGECGGDLGGKS